MPEPGADKGSQSEGLDSWSEMAFNVRPLVAAIAQGGKTEWQK
jgi:hypothetical protein